MALKTKLTREQYIHLNPMAMELHDYWMNYKPEMYNELADSGKLWPLLKTEGDRLNEMVIELTPQIGLAGAKEMARAEIYNEDEETEQDRRNRELWESYCELRSLLNGQMNEEE